MIKSTYNSTVKALVIFLFINAACNSPSENSRSEVEPELDSLAINQEKLKNYSFPIYVYYNGEKSFGGTCFFVKSQSDLFLISAFHVVLQRSVSTNAWVRPQPYNRVPDSFQIKFLEDSATFSFARIDSNKTAVYNNDTLMDIVVVPANFLSRYVRYPIDLSDINTDREFPKSPSSIFSAGYIGPDSSCDVRHGYVIYNYGLYILVQLIADFGMSGSPCFVAQGSSVKLAGILLSKFPYSHDVLMLHPFLLVDKILSRKNFK